MTATVITLEPYRLFNDEFKEIAELETVLEEPRTIMKRQMWHLPILSAVSKELLSSKFVLAHKPIYTFCNTHMLFPDGVKAKSLEDILDFFSYDTLFGLTPEETRLVFYQVGKEGAQFQLAIKLNNMKRDISSKEIKRYFDRLITHAQQYVAYVYAHNAHLFEEQYEPMYALSRTQGPYRNAFVGFFSHIGQVADMMYSMDEARQSASIARMALLEKNKPVFFEAVHEAWRYIGESS